MGADHDAGARRAAEVSVCDNGAGIAEELRDRVFEPFFSTSPEKGTGLGLALWSRSVRENGGRSS